MSDARDADRARAERGLFLRIFPSIMLPMFIAVLDQTIVATALPAISTSLGQAERITWIVVAYLVANTIAAPVYGRLGDAFGRARVIVVALLVMMTGSLGCALAPDMTSLLIARFVQGLGGGGLMTLSQALIGETIPPRARGRYQGYLAGVIVTANAFGPVVGGWLTLGLGWRSIFWMNLPLGLLALMLARRLPRNPGPGAMKRFDTGGLLLFICFIAPALVAVEQARKLDPALAPLALTLLALSVGALVLLAKRESRHEDPLLPIAVLRNPAIWRSDAMVAFHGAALVSLINYTPLYLRAVRGLSAAQTGYVLLPMAFGIGVGSLITGRLVSRTGRTAIFPSLALIPANLLFAALALLHDSLSVEAIALLFGALSLFLGSVMGVAQVTVQNAAGGARLGSAAASVQFSRAVGASFGAAIVGAVLFAVFAARAPVERDLFAGLMEYGPSALDALAPAARAHAQAALQISFRAAFLTINVFALLALLAAWSIPARRL